MNGHESRTSGARRRLLQTGTALALVPWLPARAAADDLPEFPALTAFLAGRKPRIARVHLTLPQLADNGQTVPMKVTVDGPFAPNARVTAINLFSEANPVPEMAVFEFPAPSSASKSNRAFDSQPRSASSRWHRLPTVRFVAAAAEVIVTIAGCMDGT